MEAILTAEPARRRDLLRQELVYATVAAGTLGTAFALSHNAIANGPIICPLRRTTGIPCPFCGMTTSFVNFGDGRIAESFQASPIGPIFFTALAILLVASVWALARGRKISVTLPPRARKIVRFAWLPLMILLWTYQLVRIGPLQGLLG